MPAPPVSDWSVETERRSFLDSRQAMCPIQVDKLGNAKCECVLENFGAAPDQCSLAHLVTRNPGP
eukprot:638646-Prorocentrum_minimum.AAC.1